MSAALLDRRTDQLKDEGYMPDSNKGKQGKGKQNRNPEPPPPADTDKGSGGEIGRPSKGKQINVRLSPDMLRDLDDVVQDLGLDVSSVIRMILSKHLEDYASDARRSLERKRRKRQGEDYSCGESHE